MRYQAWRILVAPMEVGEVNGAIQKDCSEPPLKQEWAR